MRRLSDFSEWYANAQLSQCDRQRPTCGQCTKSARTCGGYRDAADLVFRDQTQMLHARASQPPKRNEVEKSPSQEPSDTLVPYTADVRLTGLSPNEPMLVRSPKLNAERGLIHFFTNNFVCSGARRGTNLFWVPNNFDDLLKDESASHSIQSVGAMALARLQRSTYYYREAQKYYGLALLSLAESWRHDVATNKEATMIAILFLGFFEVLASDLSTSRQSWMTHLGGLGVFLAQCQKQLQNTSFGARMLLQTRSQVILNAIQTKSPVPAQFQSLSKGMNLSMALHVVQADAADNLMIRLATLQAQCWTSGAASTLLAELIVLDNDIDRFIESGVSSWSVVTQPSGCPPELWWEARHDLYPTPAVAHLASKMRAARILTHDLIHEVGLLLSLPGDQPLVVGVHQITHNTPNLTIRQLVADICATIPIFYRPSYATVGSGGIENRPQLGTTYWLFWPLEIMGSMKTASLELKEWTRQCFERIYETTGIVKAQLAAQKIQERISHTNVA